MASRGRYIPVLSLIVITTFLSAINGNSVNSSAPRFPFDCGNGLTLGYPFHPQIHHGRPFCGYPDLAISCTDNQPIIRISNNPYTVRSLNISASSITVTYAESCPIPTHAIEFHLNSPLNYSKGNKIVRFYYNCTVYPPSSDAGIKCLQRGAKHSYAFVEGSEPESNWMHYCESIVTAPVTESAADDLRNGSGNAIELGFGLTWESSDRLCKLCEESGGLCGYSSNGGGEGDDEIFSCYCSDGGNSSLTCDDSGEVWKTSQHNYVAIGWMMLGGVIVLVVALIIVILLFINIKISVRKQGFNRLPTISAK